MTRYRSAQSVCGIPTPVGGKASATVGQPMPGRSANVTRILVSDDLPGDMERVRVYADRGFVMWEGPLHCTDGVTYGAPSEQPVPPR